MAIDNKIKTWYTKKQEAYMSDITNNEKTLKLTALKIITAVIYGIVSLLAIVVFTLVLAGWIRTKNGIYWAAYLVVLLSYGSVLYAISLIPAIIGLFISIIKRNELKSRKTLNFFIVFSILPVATFLLLFLPIIIIL